MSVQSNGGERNPTPDGPMERMEDTFPRLSPEMAARIARYGVEETYRAGQTVYERGQRNVDFFFLLGGHVELFDYDDAGAPQVVTVLGERQFPGELYLFNGRKSLLNVRAVEDIRVVRVPHDQFRRLVSLEPDIGEIILRAFILRRVGVLQHQYGRVVVIGPAHGGDTIRLQRFLTRNAYPHRLVDTDRDVDAARYLSTFHVDKAELPVVLLPAGRIINNPPEALLADELGLTEALDAAHVYDVAVVGAGPAGLAAAVYAASEGLNTIVIEALAPGGQAGSSSKIENYLGFPTGISGQALAGRAQVQAQKFGATLAISRAAVSLDCSAQPYRLRLEREQDIAARSIVVATGAKYRKLSVPNYDRYEGKGIYYAATAVEARLCTDKEVVLVGGGNSAGQAAMFLAGSVGHVHILVRAAGLSSTMSDYLVERIKSSPKITLHARTEITALDGEKWLRQITWTNRDTGASDTRTIEDLFVMIGAEPNTGWLANCLELDRGGFVKTGFDAAGRPLDSPFATAMAGVYAVGDVRAGSVKRVASGVGEGSVVVQSIHRYLHPPAA